jgi:hypothetical protein
MPNQKRNIYDENKLFILSLKKCKKICFVSKNQEEEEEVCLIIHFPENIDRSRNRNKISNKNMFVCDKSDFVGLKM